LRELRAQLSPRLDAPNQGTEAVGVGQERQASEPVAATSPETSFTRLEEGTNASTTSPEPVVQTHPQEATAVVSPLEQEPARPSDGFECGICQMEVVVRIAFRPCGHTACRDCVSRLVEINQRCHICRATIESLQAVYI